MASANQITPFWETFDTPSDSFSDHSSGSKARFVTSLTWLSAYPRISLQQSDEFVQDDMHCSQWPYQDSDVLYL